MWLLNGGGHNGDISAPDRSGQVLGCIRDRAASGYPLSSAFTVSAALAQIGEFSFILAGLGVAHQLLPPEGLSLIVAGSLLSISLNPLVFASTDLLIAWSRKIFWLRDRSELGRAASFTRLQEELEARVAVQTKAAHHKSYRPEELAERFPLPGIKRLNV